MKVNQKRGRLWAILLCASMTLAVTGCNRAEDDFKEPPEPTPTQPLQTEVNEEQITEEIAVPLVTEYIILSYPSEMEDMVSVTSEEMPDGQQIIFTTEFTGEELELFRFLISKSGTQGYELGVLSDDQHGDLIVCVDVKDYSNGNWNPEDYAQLMAMQDRVNDIIIQFHEDPRFTSARGT